MLAGFEHEIADSADCIGSATVLDLASGNSGMPVVMSIEITNDRPDLVNRRINDCAAVDGNHDPNLFFRESSAAAKTESRIVVVSSSELSGAHSNDADHSAKQRSPSVIGVRLSVAM